MDNKDFLELIEKQVHWCNRNMFLNRNAVINPAYILISPVRLYELKDYFNGVRSHAYLNSETGQFELMGIKVASTHYLKDDHFDIVHSSVWNNITFRNTKDGVPMAVFLHMLAGGKVIVKDKFDYTAKESAIESIKADGTVVLTDTMIKEYNFEDLTLIPLPK